MAIRKPNLSVKEARHLAATRNAALEGNEPLTPLPAPNDDANIPPAAKPILDNAKEPATQVFLSAPVPAAGVSKSFDFLSRQYPPEKALRMVLRRALDNYELLLENGKFQEQPLDYAVEETSPGARTIQTSRMMRIFLLTRARAFFDPLGFESDRAFGRKLASAALAAFFASEPRRL